MEQATKAWTWDQGVGFKSSTIPINRWYINLKNLSRKMRLDTLKFVASKILIDDNKLIIIINCHNILWNKL